MFLRRLLMPFAVTLVVWTLAAPSAYAQSSTSFPYGTTWKETQYKSANELWLSAGLVVAHRPSQSSVYSPPRDQVVYGIEARYHFNPKLALMTGVHFGGNTVEDIAVDGGWIDQVYRELYWQVGVDFGVIESKYYHLQIGPRLGLQSASIEVEGDDPALVNELNIQTINATGLFAGAAVRAGVFVVPSCEVGLHIQMDYTMGAELSGFGREIGGYGVVHF